MSKKKERQSNIELLRILAIMGVIVLHYNNPVMGGAIAYAKDIKLNLYVLYILESLFCCGVNLFMLVSGYFMCTTRKRNLWKPVELLVQVMVFREIIYLAQVLLHVSPFSLKTAVTTLLPKNYFVILYCVVFLISPYINVMMDRLSGKSLSTLIIISILAFSVYPTAVDLLGEIRHEQLIGLSSVGMYGNQWGYTIVNFILMYLLGAYLRKGNARILSFSSKKLLGLLAVDIILMTVWARFNDMTGFFTERTAWSYCNPLVILEAVIVFLLFSRINMGSIKIINKLSEGVFSVFLLHAVFLPYLHIEKFATGNVFLMIVHIMVCAVVLYVICWCVHQVYHFITDPIFNKLSGKYTSFYIEAEG